MADLTPDADAIVVTVFMQVCSPAAAGNMSIQHRVIYGDVVPSYDETVVTVTGEDPFVPVRIDRKSFSITFLVKQHFCLFSRLSSTRFRT